MQGPFLQQNQLQRLQMSLAMQQSLVILQMPIFELEKWVDDQIEQNPLLNKREKNSSNALSCHEIPHVPSLFSHLMNQARQICSDQKRLQMFEQIIGNLEPTGFLCKDFSSEEIYLECLADIRQFDPPGIGAKNIADCLLLQLEALGKKESVAYTMIQENWEELIKKQFKLLQKTYNLTEKALQKIIQNDIATLDPFPGYRFQENTVCPHFSIDMYLKRENNHWKITIPQPDITIETTYTKGKLSKEEQVFLSQHKTKAEWIIAALEKRRKTLYKIASYVVHKQQDYLLGNSFSLAFVNGQEIAKKLNLHESTVARALSGKNLSSPIGIFSLKQLLSKSLTPDISCDKAKKLLQKLIQEENKKKPLSDSKLLAKMQALGVPCARRTITKYRQSLNIPSTRLRREE